MHSVSNKTGKLIGKLNVNKFNSSIIYCLFLVVGTRCRHSCTIKIFCTALRFVSNNIFSVSMREGERREMKGWLSNLTLLRCYSLLTYSPNIFCSLRNYVSLFNYLLILYITSIDCETHERAKYCGQM